MSNATDKIQAISTALLNNGIWEDSGTGITFTGEGCTVYTPSQGPACFPSLNIFDAAKAIVDHGDRAVEYLSKR